MLAENSILSVCFEVNKALVKFREVMICVVHVFRRQFGKGLKSSCLKKSPSTIAGMPVHRSWFRPEIRSASA